MALLRSSKGGITLNKYLVARVFAFDDHVTEARAACVAKGWDDVRRGPPLLIVTRTVAKKSSDKSDKKERRRVQGTVGKRGVGKDRDTIQYRCFFARWENTRIGPS